MKTILVLVLNMLFINAIAQRTVFVETEKTTLHTTIYSEEKSETIILLHGGPGVPDDMPEVVQQLTQLENENEQNTDIELFAISFFTFGSTLLFF